MFTGLIQDLGRVRDVGGGEPRRLGIETSLPAGTFSLGESVAIDGVCLTVVERTQGRFVVEAAGETLACTAIGSLRVGDRVHLERAIAMGERLGGHLVLGHVDGVGRVTGARSQGGGLWVEVEAPPNVAPFLLEKGSIAVDGVSLTINGFSGPRFHVLLIPETLTRTKLGKLAAGALVNLEADVIGKYVARLLGVAGRTGVDLERLRQAGFA